MMLSRRLFVGGSLLGGLGLLSGMDTVGQPSPAAPPGVLRFVHMSDMHVFGERRSAAGWAAALESLQSLAPAPQFILTGGDHIWDAFATDRGAAQDQWKLYRRVVERYTSLPVYATLGNHDIWGWGNSKADSSDTAYGKAMAMEYLRLRRSYYSMDHGGWHFIVLDNIARRENRYYGALDPEQRQWLADDLRKTGTQRPICLVSHIPLLSACVFFDVGTVKADGYSIPDGYMHQNVREVLDLLDGYNVRLAISGHIHLADRVEYRGISFICDGAVCGGWWLGAHQGCDAGYGVFDLASDGTFKHQYREFGWKA